MPKIADEEPTPAPVSPPVRSVLHWRDVKRTPAWNFNGAAAGRKWQTSEQVEPTALTEAEYDAAITAAAGRQ